MEYLIVVSIGPVQSFIGSARKLEDFWSGSYLLSDVTKQAIKTFMKLPWQAQQLIQPQLIEELNADNFDMAALPNRFLFKVITDDDMSQLMQNFDTGVRQDVYLMLKKYVKDFFRPLVLEQEKALEQQIDEQLFDFIELYWAFVPYNPKTSFAEQRELLEENLASVKNIRQGNYHVEYGLACTVCGQRSALTKQEINTESSYANMRQGIRKLWGQIDTNSRKVSKNEHLCAVCTAKRQQRSVVEKQMKEEKDIQIKQAGFPSVSYFIQSLEKAEKAAAMEETFDIQGQNDPDVDRYYAMVKFDGDNMGKWIATADSINEARDKTAKLTNFAQKGVLAAKKNKHLRVVYSGGDDVLAVGSVVDILKFTAEIRENFADNQLGIGEGRTASAGVIIAPETYPLQSVIAMANDAEATAKSFISASGQSKNAFSLVFMRRSGQIRQITLPFELKSLSDNLLNYIVDTANYWGQLKISRSFIYHFENSFQKLNSEYQKTLDKQKLAFYDNPPLVAGELRRLINNLSTLKKKDKNYVNQLTTELTELYTSHRGSFLSFIQLLEIIVYLATFNESKNDIREDGSHAL